MDRFAERRYSRVARAATMSEDLTRIASNRRCRKARTPASL
jgi:hypothetical protein